VRRGLDGDPHQAKERQAVHRSPVTNRRARSTQRTHRQLARLEELIGGGTAASAGMDAAMLSPRQQQVLAMVVSGATNRDISLRLAYSVSTVKSGVATILRTFGLDNRTQLSAYVARNPHLIGPGARTVD
jgi:DNA-binding NarL/FixJ family response regulator